MGSYLADTNLLLRLADPNSEQHAVATQALARLLGQGNEVYLTPENFIEFWAEATRPVEGNGFGWTSERTAKEVADLQERFPKLREWLSSYCMGGRIVEISREGDGEISNYSANTKKRATFAALVNC